MSALRLLLLVTLATSAGGTASHVSDTASGGECSTSTDATTLEDEVDASLAQKHVEMCEQRLAMVQRAGRLPRRVAFPALTDRNVQNVFPVEKAWREELVAAGYVQTRSVLSATFVVSKQQFFDLLPFGAVCNETQLFNHIRGQHVWVDKLNLTRTLRAAGLAHLQPTTYVFGDGDEAATELRALDAALSAREALPWTQRPSGSRVAFIHKRRAVENSKGITLLTWAELARRRASDAAGHGLRSFLTPGVLQSYLDPPLLLARKKVDLRCYVLVASVRPLAVFFHKTFMTRRSPKLYSPSTTDKHDGALTVAAHLDLPHGMSAEEALSASQLPPDTMAQILHNEDRLQGTPPAEWLEAVFVPRLMRLASQALHAVLHAFSPDAGYFSLYGLDVLVDEQLNTYFSEMNFSPQLSDTGAGAWKRQLNRILVREIVPLQEAVLEARALPERSGGEAALMARLRERASGFLPLAMSDGEGGVRWYHEVDVS